MSARDTGTEQSVRYTARQFFFAEVKLHATIQHIAHSARLSRTSLHYYSRSGDELMKQVFNAIQIDNLRLTILPILNSTYRTIKL